MLYPLHFLLFLLYADIEPPKLILYFSNLFTIFHFFLFGGYSLNCVFQTYSLFSCLLMLLKNISFSSSFCCSVNVYFRRIRLLFHEYNTFFSHSEVINASPSSSSLLSFSSSSSSPPLLLLLFFYGVSFSCKLLFFCLLGLVSLKVEVLLSCLVILDCSL